MCGRFVSASSADEIAKYFEAEPVDGPGAPEAVLEPSYNVAPTNDVYAVIEREGLRHLETLHWGLVPLWAKDMKIGNRLINARAETLSQKNAFKQAFRKRRCIIPADGFYEWTAVPGQRKKQPWFIHRADGEPLAFAGLWETWRGPERDRDEAVLSCTIITGSPNEKIAAIHDRMPVILPRSAWSTWLDPTQQDLEAVEGLLLPAPSDVLDLYRVSTDVNNVRNRGPQLADPIDETGA